MTPKGFKIMKRTSILRFGAISAFLCGALYLLVGVTHFLLPREQLRGATGVDAAFFESLASSSAVFTVHYWLVVLPAFSPLALSSPSFNYSTVIRADSCAGPHCLVC